MRKLPYASLLAALVVAACGGSIGVDPITRGETAPTGGPAPNGEQTPEPVAPIAPYTGVVQSSDVSILYPLPLAGESTDFVRPAEAGAYGALLSKSSFDVVVPSGHLERVSSEVPSGYDELALVSVRLDNCSARKGPGTCATEVRAVFQAIYDKTGTAPDDDPTVGSAATDGALHIVYDVSEAELVIMMKQLLTLKQANGDLPSARLEPSPTLVQQGLGGNYAKGLRAILLEHLGVDRIARITTFDHNMDPDSDGWTFEIFDRVGGNLTRAKLPTLGDAEAITVAGSSALLGPIAISNAESFQQTETDSVEPLVRFNRPEKGTPEVATTLQPAFEAALRIQNPTIHNAETTDCANCHLAEGAHLIAENVYALKSTNEFTAAGGTNYLLDRISVTNLHAFGYLHRRVSIMQRTANESVVVRDWMEQKVK